MSQNRKTGSDSQFGYLEELFTYSLLVKYVTGAKFQCWQIYNYIIEF